MIEQDKFVYAFATETASAGGDKHIAIIPGFAHTAEHFHALSQALLQEGIRSTRFTIFAIANMANRNSVTFNGGYQRVIDCEIEKLRADPCRKFDAVIGHSMGGRLVQRYLQKHDKEQQTPLVLMAPLPHSGLFASVRKTATTKPKTFYRFVVSFFKDGVKGLSDAEIKCLFFDESTPDEVVSAAKLEMQHASFRVFLEGLYPYFPHKEQKRAALLLYSDTDYLFPPSRYTGLANTYPRLQEQHVGGGHDFYIHNAQATANSIAQFLDVKQ